MTPEQLEDLKVAMTDHVEKVIVHKVNGKIDKIQKNFDEYIKLDVAWKEGDMKWKEEVNPVRDLYKGTNTFFKIFEKIAKWLAMTGAGAAALYYFYGKIK